MALVAAMVVPMAVSASSTVYVSNLQPSYTAPGGGGIWSSYQGPPDYGFVSPGTVAVYNGKQAGIIYAGVNVDPTHGDYEDQGLFAFDPTESISDFLANPPTYDFDEQYGTNPVWVYIEVSATSTRDTTNDKVYQFVPTTPSAGYWSSGYHTVNTGEGNWQEWNPGWGGDTTGQPLISLSTLASDNTGSYITRVYITLGMGDSYHTGGPSGVMANGTVAWVDTATVDGVTYDFALPTVTVSGTDAAPTVAFTAPSGIDLDNQTTGMMSAGWNTTQATQSGTVTLTEGTSGAATWTVTALGAANMVNGSSTPLQNYLLIGNTSLTGGWFIANGGSGSVDGYSFSGILTYSNNTLTDTLPFFADQYVTPTDALGVYTDTITFTATCMP
jgi:hypothetical protein